MALTLGLDIGANSIGWAIVDPERQTITDMGVRVFPAGVNQYNTNKEETKNQSRRAARGLRRQYARRRWRKVKLVELLNRHGLTPFTSTDLNQWKKSRDLESKPHLRDWFMLNPYDLRAAALQRKLDPHELGRVFYHMVQRRGFLSNRKSGGSEESTIFEGKKETGTVGIAQVRDALRGEPTLGTYLSKIDPHQERIRNRYTERKMYVDEAKTILEAQSHHHAFINEDFVSELLGKDTQKNMDGVLFFQRPLRSARHLLGKCPFEPGKARAPITSFEFEAFRVWSWVNTVEYMGEKLAQAQREILADILFSTTDKVSFGTMKRKLGYAKKDEFFNYKDDDKIPGARVTAAFRKAFGTDWKEWPTDRKELLWHDVITATDDEWLSKRLLEHWALTSGQTDILMGLKFKHDYGSLSRKALRNILPFVESGYRYDQAALLGGVRNAFGKRWESLDDAMTVVDTVLSFRRSEAGTQLDQIRAYLSSQYGLTPTDLKRLYHHSQNDEVEELMDELPKPDTIKNPVVMQALHEVRKLVNTLLRHHGRFEAIHLELARDLGKSARERSEDRKFQKQNEEINDRIRKRLLEYGQPDSYDFRLKLKLYEELKDKMCPYTGKPIRLSESSTASELGLFGGQVQIEHIIPYSRSLTNAFGNLTLCDADVNRQKGNKMPFEFYSEQGTWEDAKLRARTTLPYKKYQRFIRTELDEDPINRMLNDTRYISREMHGYLKKICANVVPVNGALTADVRHHWGLNTILNEEDAKNRDDHRHHAIDAVVVALTTRSMVKAASDWNKYNRDRGERRIPAPWEGLRDQVGTVAEAILVSHKKVNRVLTRKETVTKRPGGNVYRNQGLAARGALHKESIYGRRRSPDGEVGYHLRKPLSSITKVKQLHKVVDLAVRNSMLGVLRDKGLSTDMKADIPANTFTYFDEAGKLRTNVFLASGNGLRLPVFKVRVKEELSNAVELSKGRRQHVNPRNNHHVALYRSSDGDLSEECVTFWEVVERIKLGKPAISPVNADGQALEETLQINDLFLIGYEGDIESARMTHLLPHLYRVQKLSSKDYWFRHHLASTLDDEMGMFIRMSLKAWDERKPRKVWMTVDGRIEPYRR